MEKKYDKTLQLQQNAPIGVFDSGVGGLTVLKSMIKVLPDEKYIYFGDTLNLPYGSKSKDELVVIVKNIMNFFTEKHVKAVIMGCNTTSAVVYEEIKNDYDFTIYPVIQCSCENILKNNNYKKLGVFATQATVNSKMYTKSLKKINKNIEVVEIACPEWVKIVESNIADDKNNVECIKNYLEKINNSGVEKIILGCTHYPYLMKIFKQFVPENKFINPANSFTNYIKSDLISKNLISQKKDSENEFFVTSNPVDFVQNSKLFLEIKKLPILIKNIK